MPAVDLLSAEELELMIETVKRRGGFVSYKHNADGTESPYELNINYLRPYLSLRTARNRSPPIPDRYSILLSSWSPGIYIHSLPDLNYEEGVQSSGIKRRINRKN